MIADTKELHQFTLEELIEKSFVFFQLEVKDHIREAQKKKAYDPKKSCWVPNPDKNVGGYFEGISEEEIKYDTFAAGKKLSVNVSGEVILHFYSGAAVILCIDSLMFINMHCILDRT